MAPADMVDRVDNAFRVVQERSYDAGLREYAGRVALARVLWARRLKAHPGASTADIVCHALDATILAEAGARGELITRWIAVAAVVGKRLDVNPLDDPGPERTSPRMLHRYLAIQLTAGDTRIPALAQAGLDRAAVALLCDDEAENDSTGDLPLLYESARVAWGLARSYGGASWEDAGSFRRMLSSVLLSLRGLVQHGDVGTAETNEPDDAPPDMPPPGGVPVAPWWNLAGEIIRDALQVASLFGDDPRVRTIIEFLRVATQDDRGEVE
jgi:hypothetical protein